VISSSPRRQTGTVHFALTKQPAPKVASGFSTTPSDLGAPIVPETRPLRNDGLHLRHQTRVLLTAKETDINDHNGRIVGMALRKSTANPEKNFTRPQTGLRAPTPSAPGAGTRLDRSVLDRRSPRRGLNICPQNRAQIRVPPRVGRFRLHHGTEGPVSNLLSKRRLENIVPVLLQTLRGKA